MVQIYSFFCLITIFYIYNYVFCKIIAIFAENSEKGDDVFNKCVKQSSQIITLWDY